MTHEENLDPQDWAELRALAHRAVDDAVDYMASLRERPAWERAPAHVKAHFAGPPPAGPQSVDEIYEEWLEYVRPYQLGNSHPRFWGWVLGTGTPMSALAAMLAASTDSVSGIYSFVANNYVELQVLDWCKQLLGYPLEAGGLLTSGCSASNLIALAVARNAGAGFDVRTDGLAGAPASAAHADTDAAPSSAAPASAASTDRAPASAAPVRLTVYCSVEAHSSLTKAVELLGMGTNSLRRVPTDDAMRIDLDALAAMVAADRANGLRPVCVVGVAGTTNTGSIDDLPGLADFCAAEGLWFHVDGAFGAWAAIAPESRDLVAGMERADSLAFDLHKWMNLAYPVGCVLVRDAQAQLDTFSLTPSYLAHGEGERGLTAVDVPWLSDFGFELSRGFHALKVWMSLKEHGTDRFAQVIQQNIDQARYLEDLVAAAPELEQALPAQLNIVCFRYVGRRAGGAGRRSGGSGQDAAGQGAALSDATLDQLNKEIELELQERGIAVPSVSTVRGRKYLHVAVANHRSRREDFDLLVREVVRLGEELAPRLA
jgi:glutamate/tyrosine decarboxylase-like PLP-dependent enzyme